MNRIPEIGDNREVDIAQKTKHPFYDKYKKEFHTWHAIHAINSEKPTTKVTEDENNNRNPEEAKITAKENKECTSDKEQNNRVEVLKIVVDEWARKDCPKSLPLHVNGCKLRKPAWDRGLVWHQVCLSIKSLNTMIEGREEGAPEWHIIWPREQG